MTKTRPVRQVIHGILLLDKPSGMTSNTALQMAKRAFNAEKAGHTGSLDPLASGLLPVCFGHATRYSQFLLDAHKSYLVTIQFGATTTTADADGEILTQKEVPTQFNETQLAQVLRNFVGNVTQIPPMYSAVKHQGKQLYKYARQGIEIERTPRPVTIHSLEIQHFAHDKATLYVQCSKGTYIRTLVEDIGAQLGFGAHVHALRRLAAGPFGTQHTLHTLDTLTTLAEQSTAELHTTLLPLESCLTHLPEITINSALAFYMSQGQPVRIATLPQAHGLVRIFKEDNQFLGLGEMMGDGRIKPKKFFPRAT